MEIQRVEEAFLSEFQISSIQKLFKKCFEVYPADRIYYNQMPHFRFLAWEKPYLIGHMGIAYRAIRAGEQIFRVYGVVDLCVEKKYWKQNVASSMIHEAGRLGREQGVHFMVLTTSKDSLYTRNGFRHVENSCRWVLINNHHTFGVVQRNIGEGFMIKELSEAQWPEGDIDLMGHMF